MLDYYNDNDPGACEWLRELIKAGEIPDGKVDERSILEVEPADLVGFRRCHFFAGIGGWAEASRLAGVPEHVRFWTGSPPCQPFSAAGKGMSRDDPRHLAPHFIKLVGASRPRLLFGEQVASKDVFGKAATSADAIARLAAQWDIDRIAGKPAAKRRGQPAGAWAWVDDLSDRLEAARYAVGASDIPAAGVGAPNIRQRTYFGAVRMDDSIGVGCEAGRDGDHRGHDRDEPGAAGEGGRMADSDGRGFHGGRGRRPAGRVEPANGRGPAGRMDDSERAGLERCERDRGISRRQAGAEPGQAAIGAGVHAGGMADQHRDGCASPSRGTVHDAEHHAEPRCGSVGLADRDMPGAARYGHDGGAVAAEAGLWGGSGDSGQLGHNAAACAPDHFWSAADWLFCRDEQWRPVEPGTFPLDHGVQGRVGLLRGYGNAINPHAAAIFIKAFLEAVEGIRT